VCARTSALARVFVFLLIFMHLIATLAVLLQLPLSLLRAGKDNPMLVELKNGETYNGILINCDIWYVLPPSP